MSKFIDIAGQKFGKLIALERAENTKGGMARWKCSCECGNTKVIVAATLRKGTSKSCGCTHIAAMNKARFKNGARRSSDPGLRRLYAAWHGMKQRCRNPNHKDFKYYGARGIDVCERWESFENFMSDMGTRPEGKTLDRIRVNENYSPDNCRWATHVEQRANQRRCNHE